MYHMNMMMKLIDDDIIDDIIFDVCYSRIVHMLMLPGLNLFQVPMCYVMMDNSSI